MPDIAGMKGVIKTDTGILVRAGYTDFENDGQFNPVTEQVMNNIPYPLRVFGNTFTEGFYRWDGANWIAIIDPTSKEGLLAWYAAYQGVLSTLEDPALDTETVRRWEDFSVNANHADQASGLNKPQYLLNQINGLPAVYFNGANKFLEQAIAMDSGECTLFFVFNCAVDITDSMALQNPFSRNATRSLMAFGASHSGTNETISCFTRVGGVDRGNYIRDNVPTGWHHLTIRQKAGLPAEFWIDGVSLTVYNLPLGGFNAVHYLLNGWKYIGVFEDGFSFDYNGLMAEIITYGVALSDTDLQDVHSYIQTIYGL